MNKLKLIFSQTLMVSTAVLFGIGVQTAVQHLAFGADNFVWDWYTPFSIIIVGFFASVPSVLLLSMDELPTKVVILRIVLHFFCIGAIVFGGGYLFRWYGSVREFIPVAIMYVIIYFFVWAATAWIGKTDEKQINKAIENFRDEE